MDNDEDLKARFRALAGEDAAASAEFPRERLDAYRDFERMQRMRGGSKVVRALAVVGASAIAAVLLLAVGLVWGVGTGLAATQVQDGAHRRQSLPLAMVRSTPVRTALAAISCNTAPPTRVTASPPPVTATPPAPTQGGIPVVELPSASARSADRFASVLGIRQVAGGKLLVNDAGSRQLKLLDSTLAHATLVSDSTPGTPTSYGSMAVPLIRHLGDSSLFPDFSARALLVLDGAGRVARVAAPPNPNDLISIIGGFSATDPQGRLVYRSALALPPGRPGMTPATLPDSVPIVRADFERRQVDTVARVYARLGNSQSVDRSDPSQVRIRLTLNPLPALDEWSLLSDGTVAIVRARDYHVDWVSPTGVVTSSPKLPFDWKRLTDDDKQRLIDSTRVARETAQKRIDSAYNAGGSAGGSRGGRGGGGEGPPPTAPQTILVFPPLSEIVDYYPPIRRGAAMSDLDGNLWILPTSSAQSRNGELVYDVVNVKGDFHRVRLPVGRSIAGFGKGGVVYLQSGDKTNGFYLERTRLPAR